MQTLDKRITALEQASPTDIGPIFIHLIGLDTRDNEIVRIEKGSKLWERQPNESEQELKNRAISELPPPRAGCSTVFLCY